MQDELLSALTQLPMTPTTIGAPTSTLDAAAAAALGASTSPSVSQLPYELPPVFKSLGDDSDDQKSVDDVSQFSASSLLSASEMGIKMEPGVRVNHDISAVSNNEGLMPIVSSMGPSYGISVPNIEFTRSLQSVPETADVARSTVNTAATTAMQQQTSQTVSALVSPTMTSGRLFQQLQPPQGLNNGGGMRLVRTQSDVSGQPPNQLQHSPHLLSAVFSSHSQPPDVTSHSTLLSHQLRTSTPIGPTRNGGHLSSGVAASSQPLQPRSAPVTQSLQMALSGVTTASGNSLMFTSSEPVTQHQQQHPQSQIGYTIPRYYSNELTQSYNSSSQSVSVMSSTSSVGSVFPNSNCPWYPVPELEPVTRPYKPCVVCNDRSSGYHYGVSSCEGCKGFFRRSVQKNLQYVCNKDKNCIINKVTRNRCQYCRLHKCFAMGMSREAVRNDRNRKKKDSSSSSVDGIDQLASSTSESVELTSDDLALMEAIRDAHRSTFPVPAHVELITDVSEEERLGLWDKIEELSTQGVKRIVHFAKRVPKFRELAQKDQALLLKSAIMELVILRMASRFDADGDSVLFSTGLRLTRTALQALGFDDITDTVVLFAQKMTVLKVDDVEYAVLSSICLCSGDRSGLEEPRSVDRIQERILDLFRRYVKKTYPEQPRRFAKLLMKLTDLRGISVKGGDRIFHFIKSKSEGDMPPLIVELLNRDENVCIP